MEECVFDKIIAGKIPAVFEYRDDKVVAFRDINPKAPIHILIVPIQHIRSLEDLAEEHDYLIGHMVHVARDLGRKYSLTEKGYRIVCNYGEHAGQTVDHLHFHLVGGSPLGPIA